MKKRGMKKRVLAALMTACMVVGSVPGVSLADATTDNSGISYTLDGEETTDSAKTAITLNKEAKPAGDGKYDITLTVDATKAKDQIQVNPTEVAFVLDASGSMAWCTNETHDHRSAKGGKSCRYNHDLYVSRWNTAVDAIDNMSKELKAAGVECSYIRFSDDVEASNDISLYKRSPKGETNLSTGIKKGIEVLNEKDEKANKILIILADGGSDDGCLEHHGELWFENEKQIFSDFKENGKV